MSEPQKDNQAYVTYSDDPLITETGHSFRDSVSNIDTKGNRVWIYPSKPKGTFHRWRMVVGYSIMALFFVCPLIKIDGNPFIILDLFNRRFILFGMAFWPQDFYIFALAILSIIIFIILFTAVYGRLWCGWLCPQIVFMELVYRKIEYWIEGDSNRQKKLDKMPFNVEKFYKKTTKHLIFYLISFVVLVFIASYIVGIDDIIKVISSPYNNLTGFSAVIILSFAFNFNFVWFREQSCIFVCPYARLQSVLLDKNSMIVAYDNVRGEPRGKLRRNSAYAAEGDCIDCDLCVRVCPTSIDIRNGLQLECVNCAACIDACNDVMAKVNRPKNLIRYASLNQISEKQKFKITPRIMLYSAALTILLALVVILLVSRSDVQAQILRAKGTSCIINNNGTVSNLYTAELSNKTFKNIKLSLKLENLTGNIRIVGNENLTILPDNSKAAAFFVDLPKSEANLPNRRIEIGVYSNSKKLTSVKTNFSGLNQEIDE